MEKHIMLAFVSRVTNLSEKNYPDIQGKSYDAIQTNESAIVYVERMLKAKGTSLSKIFLIASSSVQKDKAPVPNDFGDVTHLEFLKLRVVKECPQLAGKFSEQNYSDKVDKNEDESVLLEKIISQTAAIADAVMEFAQKNSDSKTIIHADITGGFRHASMVMLSTIQLLKYRGVETRDILYSDLDARRVYPVTEIHRMFSLITGADEFVNFGSVKALQDYFGENPSQSVQALLDAMKDFSDAIKICRTSVIEDELRNLDQHIKTFREHPDEDLRSELFAKIIDTVEREYGTLINGKATRIGIIRWCMDKDFWQQAMTLCTEWLPEEFVTQKICMPLNLSVQEDCKSKGRAAHKTWQQYFITDYRLSAKTTENRTFCDNLRNALKSGESKIFTGLFPETKKFWDEYKSLQRTFKNYGRQKLDVSYFQKNFPMLAAALKILFDKQSRNPNYTSDFQWFLKNFRYNQLPENVTRLFSNEELLKLFNAEGEQLTSEEKSENQWENREQDYRKLFSAKIIALKPDLETALKSLKYYFDIRRERNQINHAAVHSTKTIPELRTLIEDCIASLEKMSAS